MIRFFLAQIRADWRGYPATEIMDDILCGLAMLLLVGATCGWLVGIWGGG